MVYKNGFVTIDKINCEKVCYDKEFENNDNIYTSKF